MPIYAYRCTSCGHAQDVLQKISDPVLSTCPACGAETYVKQVTAAGFQLKGSGWYVTDFRDGNKAGAKKGDKDDKADKADAGDQVEKAADAGAKPPADAAAPAGAAAAPAKAATPAAAPAAAPPAAPSPSGAGR